ncbi:MAG: ADP-forming succinate--CoA ligase subunit beta [Candidatus Protochlamydia sp.]|nr:ADP-forming succinate--CoA ligase subunit beta [Candidatus Protochlamydia sp.]
MNIHEYQAKQILQKYGILVPEYYIISSVDEANALLSLHKWEAAVIKVQVHAGGRGKAGGVKFAKNPQEIIESVKELLGKKIVNEQTGHEGMTAYQLLISPPIAIFKEYYLGVTISREKGKCVMIASPVGGMEIERTAKEQPEKVLVLPIPMEGTFRSYHLTRFAKFMGWNGKTAQQGKDMLNKLVLAFQETDAYLFEINPLVETPDGALYALDAKLVIDDNALFRQPAIKAFYDPSQVSSNEALAQQNELSYVPLDGEIGCMVNGAGLAMATMDLIQYHGGRPANFLDVGGGASKEKVAEGFKIILSDPKVKSILVNIFGGIMNCETLALGITEAVKELKLHVPLIVRMEGTNVEQGKKILHDSGLNIQIAHHLTDAAQQAVQSITKRN